MEDSADTTVPAANPAEIYLPDLPHYGPGSSHIVSCRHHVEICWGLGNTLHIFVPPCASPSASGSAPSSHSPPPLGGAPPPSSSPFTSGLGTAASPWPLQGSAPRAAGPVGAAGEGVGEGASHGALLVATWADTSASTRQLAAASASLYAELREGPEGEDGETAAEADGRGGWNAQSQWARTLTWSAKMGSLIRRCSATTGSEVLLAPLWDLLRVCYVCCNTSCAPSAPGALWLARWLQANDYALEGVIASASASESESGERRKERSNSVEKATVSRRLQLVRSRILQCSEVEAPESGADYWGTVAACAALGWTGAAAALLRSHSSYRSDQLLHREAENGLVETVAVLMEDMPCPWLQSASTANAGGEASDADMWGLSFGPAHMQEYMRARERWRARLAKLDASEYWAMCCDTPAAADTERGLRWAVAVLLGSGEAIRYAVAAPGGAGVGAEVGARGGHWMELAVARLLHQQPQAGMSACSDVAQQCYHSAAPRRPTDGRSRAPDWQDRLLLAIISKESEVVVSLCSQSLGSWMMAHAAEMVALEQQTLLLPPQQDSRQQQRSKQLAAAAGGAAAAAAAAAAADAVSSSWAFADVFRQNLAHELLSHPATWQLALPYMASDDCRQQRGQLSSPRRLLLLRHVLLRQALVLADQRRALAGVLHLLPLYATGAAQHAAVCQALAIQHWESGRLTSALQWAAKAGEGSGSGTAGRAAAGAAVGSLLAADALAEWEAAAAAVASYGAGGGSSSSSAMGAWCGSEPGQALGLALRLAQPQPESEAIGASPPASAAATVPVYASPPSSAAAARQQLQKHQHGAIDSLSRLWRTHEQLQQLQGAVEAAPFGPCIAAPFVALARTCADGLTQVLMEQVGRPAIFIGLLSLAIPLFVNRSATPFFTPPQLHRILSLLDAFNISSSPGHVSVSSRKHALSLECADEARTVRLAIVSCLGSTLLAGC